GREGEHDTLAIFSDRGRLRPSDRSGVWSGPDSAWFKMADLPGIERGVNFFIRAVITDEDSLLYIIEPSHNGSPSRMTLISAYPNPFNAITTINLILNTRSPYQIQLVDGYGRPLDWKQEGWGEGSITIPLELPQMPSGTYFIRVSTPKLHQAIPIILTR
ncbi:MAG: T9SS type A sorting domain-containing protein, partial [bacterium]